MVKEVFNPMELDALGEMMNISLGSSATAVSNMLEHRVNITTPKVTVVDVKDFTLGNLEPAMGVQIKYVEGLDGSNIMLLRRSDVKVIVDILLGTETKDEDFELNELTISAVCEVMNQMMGSAATAMSDFLGYPVNISTPEAFDLDDTEAFKKKQLPQNAERIVVVRFSLKIEEALESEFMNVMSVELAKELLKGLGLGENESSDDIAMLQEHEVSGDRIMSREEIESVMVEHQEQEQQNAQAKPLEGEHKMSQAEIEAMMAEINSQPAPQTAGDNALSQEEIEKMMNNLEKQPEPQPAADNKLTQEEIEKMMQSLPAKEEPAQPERKLSQAEIEAMMAGADKPAEPERKLSQAEIEAMMAGTDKPAEPERKLSQAEIEAMMAGADKPAEPERKLSQAEIEAMMAGSQPAPQPMAQPAPQPMAQPVPQPMPQQPANYPAPPAGYPPYGYYPPYYPPYPYGQVPDPKLVHTKPMEMPEMAGGTELTEEQSQNLDLIMEVPLQVTVEIGRTHRKVQDILEFSKGSLVVLDKLAGEQVDLFVNGKCIAKGDVVVVDDNFGVRITEIVQKNGMDAIVPHHK